jgi:hypothetical protein
MLMLVGMAQALDAFIAKWAARGAVERQFVTSRGCGTEDYLLFLDGHPFGALEAKPVGHAGPGQEVRWRCGERKADNVGAS